MRRARRLSCIAMAWLAAGLMGTIFGVLVWLQRVPALTTRNDDLVYLLLSREVARFSYAQTWLVGAPIHIISTGPERSANIIKQYPIDL